MRRLVVTPRDNWIGRAEEVGFTYHSLGRAPEDASGVYWDESVAYEFERAEIDALEAAIAELQRLCLAAVGHVVRHPEEMGKFGIPARYWPYIIKSWDREDPYWMGRFDLAYHPDAQMIKLLEYNADTPTLVIETALVQWFWLVDRHPGADQFNMLHELLLERLKEIGRGIPSGEPLYFAGLHLLPEEAAHMRYFTDLAGQAGISTKLIEMADIGWHEDRGFVDLEGRRIQFMHKLYPWEWMAREAFGAVLPGADIGILEPPWKMLLSNKALLPLLWHLFPDHPNLLASGWDRKDVGADYIAKPILGREGANITLVRDGAEVETGGSYGTEPRVFQDLAKVPVFAGQHAIVGSWVVGDRPAGIIMRESGSPIVVNTSKVLPHLFR